MLLIRLNQISGSSHLSYNYGTASVTMIFIFYAFFGVGWRGTAWLYNAEVNSLHMRMTGSSPSITWLSRSPRDLKWRFYLIWVYFNTFSIAVIYQLYPETANRRLEDVNTVFKEGLRFWALLDKEATQPSQPVLSMAIDERGVEARAVVKSKLGPGWTDRVKDEVTFGYFECRINFSMKISIHFRIHSFGLSIGGAKKHFVSYWGRGC